jgi:uncharacterized repeat protein (TIGR03843 family)
MSNVLEILTQGEIQISGRLVDASNATLFGTSNLNESAISIIYKPIAGERPLWDFPDGNLAQREVAAYLISEIGDFGVVPPTVLREGPFGSGMVQQWIDIDESIDLAEFYRTDNNQLRMIALFDAVVNNTDRKIGHLLPVNESKVLGCDHGVTFHEDDKLRTVLWQWAGKPLQQSEIEKLAGLEKLVVEHREEIENLISQKEYLALQARINRLLSTNSFPLPSEEWPAVPWPPF